MQHRQHQAQSLIEVTCGCILLVPIALLVVDVVSIIGASHSNNHLALAAARVAANKPSQSQAYVAAMEVMSSAPQSPLTKSVELSKFNYDELQKLVTVETQMVVALPVPLPGANTTSLTASSVQPIVGIPAAR